MVKSVSLLSRIMLHTWGILVLVLGMVALFYLLYAEPQDPQLIHSPAIASVEKASGTSGDSKPTEASGDAKLDTAASGTPSADSVNQQKWEKWLQDRLNSMQSTLEQAELRSYQNKMMGRELVRLVRAAVVVLVIIAVGFPFVVWLLSRKRILGLSGLSQEVAATLVIVEERQSKLAAILRDIQIEMDYLHARPSHDLTAMMEQARSYLDQNNEDLAKLRDTKGQQKQDSPDM